MWGLIDTEARKPNIYNLDMILSVGYRVNSKRGIFIGSDNINDCWVKARRKRCNGQTGDEFTEFIGIEWH